MLFYIFIIKSLAHVSVAEAVEKDILKEVIKTWKGRDVVCIPEGISAYRHGPKSFKIGLKLKTNLIDQIRKVCNKLF